jgi:hypothetical protein
LDATRFDRFARTFVRHLSRRRVLSSLSATLAAAAVVYLPGDVAVAKCVRLGKKCDKKNKKKDTCCGGGKCKGKACKCTNGRVRCEETCCASGEICAAGTCLTGQGTCASGADSCLVATISCNQRSNCSCYQSAEGTTRCGEPRIPITACGNCTSSAQCAASFPNDPGVFCAIDIGGQANGCGCSAGEGTCVPPCPA